MPVNQLTFVVFIIHQLAEAWGKPAPQIYGELTKTGIINDYILPHYDTLHALGREYLVQDITEFVHEREARQ